MTEDWKIEIMSCGCPFKMGVDNNLGLEIACKIRGTGACCEENCKLNSEREVRLVIDSYLPSLGIIKDWPDDLHLADVLDKHIFRQLCEKGE